LKDVMAGCLTGEEELINRIRKQIPSAPSGALRLGIGDDAAVIGHAVNQEWVVTSDQFIEGVHFLSDVQPPESIGYKALARATSDIGAMGAQPVLFLLSMCLPADRAGAWLDRMAKGMGRAARRFGLVLAGGDTARSAPNNGTVALDVIVLGQIRARRAVGRGGASPGDAVFVSGRLGESQLGLELVLRGLAEDRRWRKLLKPHFYPKIAIELGQWLAKQQLASAMMDISDGLSTDLGRLCKASQVGSRIQEKLLPSVVVPPPLRSNSIDSKTLALHGGEDYGLLFTVRKRDVARIPKVFRGQRITQVGEIVAGNEVTLVTNGLSSLLQPQGWDHFHR
jgi:thiamine-monophosphate kinase